jgi:hypothetical protein
MPINLKQINILDADSIKLDKVNYNFDQLVANGGGPRGRQGSIGQDGPQGTTGQQGFQGVVGNIGNQGPQGITSPNYWKYISAGPIDAETIIPIVYSSNVPSVVNIGYLETDSEYNTKQPLVNGKIPFQWNIHRKNFSAANLRFLNDDKSIDWRLEKKGGLDQMTIGSIDPQNSTSIYQTGQMGFQGTTTSPYSFVINETVARFNADTIFNLPVNIKRNLFIRGAGAAVDKVATCMNDAGLLKFKTVAELPGTVPFGTIVSIMPSIFNNNSNFINTEYVSIISTPDKPLKISVGKGIGTYAGWYLCNGETWTNGTLTRQVPMLGDFNYKIDDNELSESPNGQGTVEFDTTNTTHITGGSDINMTATPSQLVYNITSTVGMSSVQVDPGTGSTFKIKQLPQIIYLGRTDLYWSNKGTGQAEPVPLTWILDDQNTTLSKLTPDPYPLGVTDDQSAGQSYSQQFLVTAPLGYYWSTLPTAGNISGLPGYATISGISFTDSSDFPTTIRITISVSSHPLTEQTITLGINTTSFISLAIANITLGRLNVSNITSNIPISVNISYNFSLGYYFQLVYNTIPGYAFTNTNTQPVVLYITGGTPTITPPVGGGTIAISNFAFTNNNTTLTMNISLTGIPTTGYLSAINYMIGVSTISNAPVITSAPNGITIVAAGGVGPLTYTSKLVQVTNNTGGNIFIWAGINNTNASGSTLSTVTGGFFTYSPSTNTQVIAPGAGQYYSPTSYTLPSGGVINGDLYRNYTFDTAHTVQLFWSSTPTGTKYPINI